MSLEAKIHRLSGWIGLFTAGMGFVVVAGWLVAANPLDFLPFNTVPMRPTAAVCLVLRGVALWLRNREAARAQRWAAVGAGTALAFALAGLAQRLFSFELGFDGLIAGSSQNWQSPGLSPYGALGLIAIAVALLCLNQQRGRSKWPLSAWLANFVIGINAGGLIAMELALTATVVAWPIWLSSHLGFALAACRT